MKKLLLPLFALLFLPSVVSAQLSLTAYRDVVLSSTGTPLTTAAITVFVPNTTTKVTIFSTSVGGSLDNPFAVDSLGNYTFYAVPGVYDILISVPGLADTTIEDVHLGSSSSYLLTGSSAAPAGCVAGEFYYDTTTGSLTPCGAVSFFDTVVKTPTAEQTISGFGLNVIDLNNVPKCDQFAGADAGEKITACKVALPSTGGIADSRGLEGTQAAAATLALDQASMTLLLGAGTYTFSGSPGISCTANNVHVIGLGREATKLLYDGSGEFVNCTGVKKISFERLTFDGSSSTGGDLIVWKQVRESTLRDVWITDWPDGQIGWLVDGVDNSTHGSFFNKAYNIQIDGVAAGTRTALRLTADNAGSRITNFELFGYAVKNAQTLFHLDRVNNSRFYGGHFDVGTTAIDIDNDSSKNCFFGFSFDSGLTNGFDVDSSSNTDNCFIGMIGASPTNTDDGLRTVIVSSQNAMGAGGTHLSKLQSLLVTQLIGTATAFSSLPGTVDDGTFVYCSDCVIADPCAAGGTGALAQRLNSAWNCGAGIINPLEGALSNEPRWILKVVDHTDMTAAATADDFVLWTLPVNTMIHDVVGELVTEWAGSGPVSAAVCSVGTAGGSANDLALDDDFFTTAQTIYELHDGTASGGKGALLYDSTDKFAPYMFVAGGNIEIQCDLTGGDHADTTAGQAKIQIFVSQPLANTTTEAN